MKSKSSQLQSIGLSDEFGSAMLTAMDSLLNQPQNRSPYHHCDLKQSSVEYARHSED